MSAAEAIEIMGIIVTTPSCQEARLLLDEMYKDIREGKLSLWSADADGDFTHNSVTWGGAAYFRPKLVGDSIELNLNYQPASGRPRMAVIAFYHGQFIETPLLSHHAQRFNFALSFTDVGRARSAERGDRAQIAIHMSSQARPDVRSV